MSCQSLDLDAYEQTKQAVAKDPSLGQGAFEAVTTWEDGARAVTRARSFTIATDEPKPLGGGDSAIDPMELLLATLGSCMQIGWVTQARLRGIELRRLEIKVRGGYDLRGYLNLDQTVRPGFGGLDYTVEVEADADPAVLAAIRKAVERGSPMFDNIAHATAIKGDVKVLNVA